MCMKVKKLVEILNTMDVPTFRKELTPSNVRWLLRNLRVRNGMHTNIDEVIKGLREIARESFGRS